MTLWIHETYLPTRTQFSVPVDEITGIGSNDRTRSIHRSVLCFSQAGNIFFPGEYVLFAGGYV